MAVTYPDEAMREKITEPVNGVQMFTDEYRYNDASETPTGEDLIHYVMDLEALVRWFALPFRYQDQEGEWHQNEPIWTVYDERGTYLPEADRLKRTWGKVMHDDD